jgi:hypothetical protein
MKYPGPPVGGNHVIHLENFGRYKGISTRSYANTKYQNFMLC